MLSDNNWQDCRTWFQSITGLAEEEWKARRGECLDNPSGDGITLRVRNVETGRHYEAGAFRTMSLGDLEDEVSSSPSTQNRRDVVFELRVRDDYISESAVDVAHLQATAPDNCLFQVASNFNVTETPDRNHFPDAKDFVTFYALDSTQGPAASASAGVAAITRTHAPFFDPNIAPDQWGQTSARQVELLGSPELRPHFPVDNGKLWFRGDEPEKFDTSDLTLQRAVRVGLHTDVHAIFGPRDRIGHMIRIANPPRIDQVFVAALNMYAPPPYPQHLEPKTKFLLRAAYEGTYLAALWRRSRILYLTLVGGGSFGNSPEMIARAIATAHARWASHPASQYLERVILAIYPLGDHETASVIVESLGEHGIPKKTIKMVRFRDGEPV